MTLDERQREITIKSKKGTSAGFQVSELLQANTVTMQYNTLKYKYKYNTIFRMKIKERQCIKNTIRKESLDSDYQNKSRQIPTEGNYQDKEEIHKNVKIDP